MNEVVAIMTEPREIFNYIIFSILIYVVYREQPLITNLATLTYCRNVIPLQNTAIEDR